MGRKATSRAAVGAPFADAAPEGQQQPSGGEGDSPALPGGRTAAVLLRHAPAAAWSLAQWVTLLAVVFGICGAWIAAAVAEFASGQPQRGGAVRLNSGADSMPPPAEPPVRPSRPSRSAGFGCCAAASPAELLACANATAPLDPLDGSAAPKVAVITQITGEILEYAAPAALVNALWAASRGYAFVAYGKVATQPALYDARYGKVELIRALLTSHPALSWVFWLDADAVVVHHEFDVVPLAHQHPAADLIACAEANMETNTRINSGTLLVRGSSWSRAFFDAWWLHADAAIGAPDQWTFDELWRVDAVGLASGSKVVVLPATTFNSEPPFYESFRGGAAQPVVHLMGDAAPVRRRIFKRMAAGLCASQTGDKQASKDWPPSPDWLLEEMRAGYALAAADVTQAPLQRIHSLDRMGMIYHSEGLHEERAALLRQALSLKEGIYGADAPALTHEVQVLANVLSMLERHDEALPLMQKALRLSELTRDPRGQPMLHLVAAAHGDLGSLHGRMGDWPNALRHLHKCLELEESLWGANNRHSADTVFNLGVTAQLSGDAAAALQHFQRALAAYRRHLAADHPALVRAQRRIAELQHVPRRPSLTAIPPPDAMSRPLDNQYDATYHGAPPAARKAAQSGMTTKTVLSYDNFFSEVATHPRSSTIATKKVGGSFSSQPALSAARRAGGAGGVQPLKGARPSSAQKGVLAAERALKARQAELPLPSGLSVRGKGAPGARYAPPVGATEALRRTLGAQPPAVRNVAKGRASAAVAARLAHIDALLAKSKAAAGGARGYGECWPAPLGGAPPAAPERSATPPATAPSPMLMDELTGGESDSEWAADWEVAEAMKGAEWAVADWESGRDLSAPDAEAEADEPAEEEAAEPEVAPMEAASDVSAASGVEDLDMDDPNLSAVALTMQAVQRGRAARSLAARLKAEREAFVEIADFSGALVEAVMASAMQALVADENGVDDTTEL